MSKIKFRWWDRKSNSLNDVQYYEIPPSNGTLASAPVFYADEIEDIKNGDYNIYKKMENKIHEINKAI